jgi:hypothetical protein
MPIVVTGLKEAQKAMRSLQPDLEKNLKVEIKASLLPIVKKARGYVPTSISGLSNWLSFEGRFPRFNPALVKRGIKSEVFPTRHKGSGFISLVRVVNATAAGAIFETAGRKSGAQGQKWNRKSASHNYSHSRNEHAGEWFITHIGNKGTMTGEGAKRGRLIYRAFAEDQGKIQVHILAAINRTSALSKRRVDAAKAFRRAA